MKIILTNHVRTRREKGHIPTKHLYSMAKHLIDQHDLEKKKDGSYKFTQNNTYAVLSKNGSKAVFITFFGQTGWIMENTDYGDFSCEFQSEEFVEMKKERRRKMALRTRRSRRTEPLSRMSLGDRKKLESGLYSPIELTEDQTLAISEHTGTEASFILIPRPPQNIAEVLDGYGKNIYRCNTDKISEILGGNWNENAKHIQPPLSKNVR